MAWAYRTTIWTNNYFAKYALRTDRRGMQDDDGNKCINLYTKDAATNVTSKVVSRCLDKQNGQMIWIHPIIGTVIYEKVDEEDEPRIV